jgi:hypothetical protein
MAKSATGATAVRVSLSVALLLPGFVSVAPAGAVTVAVFVNVPVALTEIDATTVYVRVAPTGTFTVSLMLPVPDAVQLPPPAATQLHDALVIAAEKVSVTVAPIASLGPVFDTTIVYVVVVPGTAVVTPSVLVMARSTSALSVSLSLAMAGDALAGSVTVTVLVSVLLVRLDANATGAVNVSELPAPAPIDAPVAPKLVCPVVPVTVPQAAVPAATQLALALSVTPDGRGSDMVVLVASDGPALVTAIV